MKLKKKFIFIFGCSFFYQLFLLSNIKILHCEAIDLVSANRFDLMAKYIYAQHREWGVKTGWPLDVYREHLHVWGNFTEFDNPKKIGFDKFLEDFHKILDSIKQQGFLLSKSIIPISGKHILNGAHRLTGCLLYNKKVIYKNINKSKAFKRNFEYFKNRKIFKEQGLSEKYLDAMALQYCELKKNTYISVLFPCVQTNNNGIEKIFKNYGNIVYEKTIFLSDRGIANFLKLLYARWASVDEISKRFVYKDVFNENYPVKIIVFESENLVKVRECKKTIRNFYKIGNYPIYINDTHSETIELAQAVLSDQNIHFLNHALLKKTLHFDQYLTVLDALVKKHNLEKKFFCIDSSAVMAAYGLRDCNDLNILHFNNDILNLIASSKGIIQSHNKGLKYYQKNIDDIIFNPENYFYYRGFKFVSLNLVKEMKIRRKEKKDFIDLELIKKII